MINVASKQYVGDLRFFRLFSALRTHCAGRVGSEKPNLPHAGASERFRKWGYKFVRTLYNLVVKVVCLKSLTWGVQGVQVLNLGVQCTPCPHSSDATESERNQQLKSRKKKN